MGPICPGKEQQGLGRPSLQRMLWPGQELSLSAGKSARPGELPGTPTVVWAMWAGIRFERSLSGLQTRRNLHMQTRQRPLLEREQGSWLPLALGFEGWRKQRRDHKTCPAWEMAVLNWTQNRQFKNSCWQAHSCSYVNFLWQPTPLVRITWGL